jgi:aryl-alcohol dehydrogenase-like predicted oxidoreductase
MDRRGFLKLGSAVGGTAMLGHLWAPQRLLAVGTAKGAADQVSLGSTGIKVSRLAQGTGTNGWGGSSDQTRSLGLQGVADLLLAGHHHGLGFWDLADQYGSHAHAKAGLKLVARDQVVILTKTHASTEAEMRKDLDRFRREIGTDMIDIVLLHCMTDADWPKKKAGAMAVLAAAKQQGMIRAHGVSCHSLPALKTAAATAWVEVDLARFNAVGASMDAPPAVVLPVLEQMKAAGKGVIGMKILGAGALRDRVDDALSVALATSALDCFTIGAASRQELDDLVARIGKAGLRA